MSVVGFDFGNSSCVIAVAQKGAINVVVNEVSHRSTPSMVGYTARERRIGEAAHSSLKSNLKNTCVQIKRLLGRRATHPAVRADLGKFSYKVVADNDEQLIVRVRYGQEMRDLRVEQVAAALFGRLRDIAQNHLANQRVIDCVISCPPSFTDPERRAILDSAKIAGLNVLRLMNESAAVALAYGILRPLPEKETRNVVFVDCGHASTNIALVAFKQGELRVSACVSDRNFGGRDVDSELARYFAADIKKRYNLDISGNSKAKLRLEQACEKLKKVLSSGVADASMGVDSLMDDVDVQCEISREDYDALLDPLFARVVGKCQEVMSLSNVSIKDVHSVEVIGGTVRVPRIQQLLTDFFQTPLSTTLNGDESVARGCALQCAMLSPSFRVREFQVHDISNYQIDISWGPVVERLSEFVPEETSKLFDVSNPIPSIKMISFHKTQPFQIVASYADPAALPKGHDPFIASFVIKVPESESAAADESGDAKPRVKVKIQLDLHGVLRLRSAQIVEDYIEEIKEEVKPDKSQSDEKQPKADAEPMDTSADASPDESTPPATPPADSSDDMDTTADKVPVEPQYVIKQKKRTRKTDIPYSQTVHGLSDEDLKSCHEVEVEMANHDRVIAETDERRNALESYVYEMRGKLEGELRDYVPDDVREKFMSALNETEDWLYGDGSEVQKSVYVQRLNDLKTTGDPIAVRKWEEAHRDDEIAALKKTIVKFQVFVADFRGGDERFAHLPGKDVDQISEHVEAADEWLSQCLAKQDTLTKSSDPAVTVAQLREKQASVIKACEPIMNRPKPKPKEEKDDESAGATTTGQPDASAADGAESSSETKPDDAVPKEVSPDDQSGDGMDVE